MKLPEAFIEKMEALLGSESEAFFHSYQNQKETGLRVNPLKITTTEFAELWPFELEPVPYCPTGFFVNPKSESGKHPFHQTGLYYIQEPSAMFVAEVLNPNPGDKVLDLSAAPGGKATQLAGKMNNTGVLVANDIHLKRARILSENVERMGITNALVTNEPPNRLASQFPGYFDKILVDAPCSGEGMFRKDPEAANYWSPEQVDLCAARQVDILDEAYKMLKSGGRLVYSTCTFSPEENEEAIEAFLDRHPDMELVPISLKSAGAIGDGVAEWTKKGIAEVAAAARLWPHRVRGEGHFAALLRKDEAGEAYGRVKAARTNVRGGKPQDLRKFEKESLTFSVKSILYERKNQLFTLPDDCPDFSSLKVLRAGLHLGELKKNRFEPNHAWAMAMKTEDVKHCIDLPLEDDRWKRYLHGETLQTGGDHGWSLVTIEGFPLGWGKEVKGTLKNFFPKGLRLQY